LAEQVEETPVEESPVEETPAPAEESPVEETPALAEQVEEVPAAVEESPVEEVPALAEQVEETPVEEAPVAVEESPVEEVPALAEQVEETPVEESPVEEVPALAEQVEETPVEESPVEELPAPFETEEEAPAAVEETPAPIEEPVDVIPPETPTEPTNIIFTIDTNVPSVSIPNIVFIVPYRDRQKQYEFFSKHMKSVLEDISPETYKILYIHQTDTRSFNRGAVKNIGFLTVKNMYPNDYQNITLVFNDIDIMPYTKNFFDYRTSPGTVKHFYGFTFTLGGIVSINAGDFERINGFPNFWAWGFEDNMLQNRVIQNGITIDRSVFYLVLDKNVLHFSDGITRNVNRTEYDIYEKNTQEGWNSISNLQYNYNPDTGFVDVTQFTTPREEDVNATHQHDMRKGNIPFPSNKNPKRRPRMGMIM
jgi:chemotaxis protein histidine kinase CheA